MKKKITLDLENIKKKALQRDDFIGNIAKEVLNYKKSKGPLNCFKCENACVPLLKGKRIPMCHLIGVNPPEGPEDDSSIIDEFHSCDGYRTAKVRKNLKELLKEAGGKSNG